MRASEIAGHASVTQRCRFAGSGREAQMDELIPDSAVTCGLLKRVRAGHRHALDHLLARHRPDLLRFVELCTWTRRCGAEVDASDVVQETHLEVCRRLGDFLHHSPMPFHVWLRKTGLRAAAHGTTGARRGRRSGRSVASSRCLTVRRYCSPGRVLARDSTPSQRLKRRELARRLHRSWRSCPMATARSS